MISRQLMVWQLLILVAPILPLHLHQVIKLYPAGTVYKLNLEKNKNIKMNFNIKGLKQ